MNEPARRDSEPLDLREVSIWADLLDLADEGEVFFHYVDSEVSLMIGSDDQVLSSLAALSTIAALLVDGLVVVGDYFQYPDDQQPNNLWSRSATFNAWQGDLNEVLTLLVIDSVNLGVDPGLLKDQTISRESKDNPCLLITEKGRECYQRLSQDGNLDRSLSGGELFEKANNITGMEAHRELCKFLSDSPTTFEELCTALRNKVHLNGLTAYRLIVTGFVLQLFAQDIIEVGFCPEGNTDVFTLIQVRDQDFLSRLCRVFLLGESPADQFDLHSSEKCIDSASIAFRAKVSF